MTTERDQILAKIRALMAKTKAAGATEAEAIAAAEKAAELLRQHHLHPSDVEITEAATADPKVRAAWLQKISAIVAYVTNTGSVQVTQWKGSRSLYIGRAPGPEIAVYLREICVRAVKSGLRNFRAGAFYRARRSEKTRRAATLDFCNAMAERLCSRLIQLFASNRDEAARTDARQAMERRFPSSKTVAIKPHNTRYGEAEHEGWSAGGKVALNRGVRDGGERLLIGKPS